MTKPHTTAAVTSSINYSSLKPFSVLESDMDQYLYYFEDETQLWNRARKSDLLKELGKGQTQRLLASILEEIGPDEPEDYLNDNHNALSEGHNEAKAEFRALIKYKMGEK